MFSEKLMCVICNNEFEVFYKNKIYGTRKKKTCSKDCHKQLMSNIQSEKIETSCLNCEKVFKITRHHLCHKRGKYCCKKCFYAHRKLTTKFTVLKCSYCNKEFKVNEKRVIWYRKKYGENVFKYCSKKCTNLSTDKTSIEKIIENILLKNNISYTYNEFKIENFTYDFLINNTNILIECDGEYWHNRNLVYDNTIDTTKKSTTNKDLRKTRAAINKNFILLRFKEFDIIYSPDIIEDIILSNIKSKLCINNFTLQ